MFAQVIVESSQCLEPSFIAKYIDPILPYCELVNCLLTLGFLVVAIIGLKQISLARQAANLNATRDALKVSAEQCRHYANRIIPLADTLSSRRKEFSFFDCFSFSVKQSRILLEKNRDIKPADVQQLDTAYYSEFAPLFNEVESFCQYLTSGLADEKDAYLCLGDAFLSMISPYIPLLVLRAQEGHKWCNTLAIFVTWYNRQKRESIEREKHAISEKSDSLDKEKALYDSDGINVLDIDSFCKCKHTKR